MVQKEEKIGEKVPQKKQVDKVSAQVADSEEEDTEGSPLPPLQTERDAKQPAITSFFLRTPVRKIQSQEK